MEELTGFEPALMVLQTISLTNLDTTPPEKMAGTSGFEPEHAGVKVLCLTGLATSQYIIWWAEQDLNLQVVSDQRFSRPLPHQPGHTAYIWCVPRDSNPYSQKRTAPSRQRVYKIPPGTHIVFRYRRQTLNQLI